MTVYLRVPKPSMLAPAQGPEATTPPRRPLFQPAGPPRPETVIIARALDTPRITLGEIGEAIGVSRFAMEKYRNGQRVLPETLRERLIAYLEAHAREIQADAEALRT
jgi:hypothetical protein